MHWILKDALILWLILGLASLCSATAFADLPSYSVVKEKSFIRFVAIQNDAPVEGRFKDFTAAIHFDHENLLESSITVEVDMGSLTVANEDVQNNLKLPQWLGVVEFPKAVFTCKQLVRMPGSENYYADGKLTLHGKTVPVVLNFQLEHFDGEVAVATGYISLRRFDYGVGQGEWSRYDVIKNEVRVAFRIFAEKK